MAPSKTCPVCDTQVPSGTKQCPSCGTDLTLFEVEFDVSDDEISSFANHVLGDEKKSLDDIISSLTSGDTGSADTSSIIEEEKYACPQCGTLIPVDATTCYNCGVEFTEDVIEQFECPICNAIVDGDATKCPSCGAEFVSEEEEVGPPAETTGSSEEIEAKAEPHVETAEPSAGTVAEEVVPEAEIKPETSGEPGSEHAAPQMERPPPAAEETPEDEDKGGDKKELTFVERMRLIREKRMKEAERSKQKPAEETPAPVRSTPEPAPETVKEPPRAKPEPDRIHAERKDTPTPPQVKRPGLGQLVKETKPLLAVTRELDIDVLPERKLIDIAIRAAKAKKNDEAVENLLKAKGELSRKILSALRENLARLETEFEKARGMNIDVDHVRPMLNALRSAIDAGDIEKAKGSMEKADAELSLGAKDVVAASDFLSDAKLLLEQSRAFGIDVTEAQQTINLAQGFLDTGEMDKAKQYSDQAKTLLSSAIPQMVKEEMRRAKASLLRAKMMGKDISRPMSLMKNASLALKSENYREALDSIDRFKKAMEEI